MKTITIKVTDEFYQGLEGLKKREWEKAPIEKITVAVLYTGYAKILMDESEKIIDDMNNEKVEILEGEKS